MKEKSSYKSKTSVFEGYAWIGCPDDQAVQKTGGRPGAKLGPEGLWKAFDRLNGKFQLKSLEKARHLVSMGKDLETNYQEVVQFLLAVKNSKKLPILIGGGHDFAYPWALAWKELNPKKNLGIINLDAHFDLRAYGEPTQPKMTSGSPFRRLIEEKIIRGNCLIEFGVQEHCNAPELWEYARVNRVKTIALGAISKQQAVKKFQQELSQLRKKCDEIYISFDLDCMKSSVCSGVSAPQAHGFDADEMFQILKVAGSDKKVTSLGLFELAPNLENGGSAEFSLSARFAAQAAWYFIWSKFQKSLE